MSTKIDIRAFRAMHGERAPVVLKEMLEQYGSQSAVAQALGVTQGSISVWMSRLGLRSKLVLIENEGEKAS